MTRKTNFIQSTTVKTNCKGLPYFFAITVILKTDHPTFPKKASDISKKVILIYTSHNIGRKTVKNV